jgi:hypothetical protein
MPVALDHYFACHPVEVDGDAAEGVAGTPVVDTSSTVFVDVIGTRVPAVGDYLECFFIGGRWVAESGGGHVVAVCPNCTACDGIRLALDGTVTDDNGTAAIHYDLATSTWHTSSGATSFGLTWPGGPGRPGRLRGGRRGHPLRLQLPVRRQPRQSSRRASPATRPTPPGRRPRPSSATTSTPITGSCDGSTVTS